MAAGPPSGPAALISDPRLLELWSSALSGAGQLAPAARRAAQRQPYRAERAATARPGGGLRLDTDEENWLAYTDDAKANLGPAMFHFALGGLPALRAFAGAADSGLREPTDRLVDENRPGLDCGRRGRRRRRHDPDGSAALPEPRPAATIPGAACTTLRSLADAGAGRVRRRL